MAFFLLTLGGSFALALVLTPCVRALALRCGLVDHPDGHRKIHGRAVPVAGGIAIFISFNLILTCFPVMPDFFTEGARQAQDGAAPPGSVPQALLLAGLVICATGVADDYKRLRGRHKLLGQLLAALVIVASGTVVRTVHFFDWSLDLGILAGPFTILWLVGAINSLNLLDGMDGLLGAVGLIITVAIAVIAILAERWEVAWMALALAGSLLGFLVFNFPPATIFLGDAGSMLIGLVIGTLAIHGSLKAPATVALAAPTALLAIPIFDTLAAIIRRKLTGRSIYTPDRGHLHHCLLRRGYSNQRVLLWVSFFCLVTAAGALASLAFKQELIALVTALAVLSMLIVTQMFGHVEFLLVRKRVASFARSFWQRPQSAPLQTEIQLQGSLDWAELWSDLLLRFQPLNLRMIRLNVNAPALHERYHARWDSSLGDLDDPCNWQTEIPLIFRGQAVGRLEVVGSQDEESIAKKVEVITDWADTFETAAAALLMPTALAETNGYITESNGHIAETNGHAKTLAAIGDAGRLANPSLLSRGA